MSEHGLLRPSEWLGWSICPGRPYLEDLPAKGPAKVSQEWRDAFDERVESYKEGGAQCQIIVDARLDLSTITGERHANATADRVLIAQQGDHSTLEVWHADAPEHVLMFLGFAAFLQHALLHNFSAIVLRGVREVSKTQDELYVFGQAATEAAHRALSVEGEPVLSQLVVSDACPECRGNEHCPAYARHQALALV